LLAILLDAAIPEVEDFDDRTLLASAAELARRYSLAERVNEGGPGPS
jgi:hypothetical protein